MQCPNGHSVEKSAAKFCDECGAELVEPAKAPSGDGVQIGEKAMVAGDVTGGDRFDVKIHGDGDAHIDQSTTNIDQSTVIHHHADQPEEREEEYLRQFEAMFADGNITTEERDRLKQLAVKLNIPENRERELFKQNRNREAGGSMGALSQETFRKAQQLLEDSKTKEALKELTPLYDEHGRTHEGVLEAYLKALLVEDPDELLTETRRILGEGIDNPAAYLYRAEAMMKQGKLIGAEKVNQKAQTALRDDIRIKAQEAKLMLATFKTNGEEGYLTGATKILDGLGDEAGQDSYVCSVTALRDEELRKIEEEKQRQEAEAKRKLEEEKKRKEAEKQQRIAEEKKRQEAEKKRRANQVKRQKEAKEKQLREAETKRRNAKRETRKRTETKRKLRRLQWVCLPLTAIGSIFVVHSIFSSIEGRLVLDHHIDPIVWQIWVYTLLISSIWTIVNWVAITEARLLRSDPSFAHQLQVYLGSLACLAFPYLAWELTEMIGWGYWFDGVRLILFLLFMLGGLMFTLEESNRTARTSLVCASILILAILLAIYNEPVKNFLNPSNAQRQEAARNGLSKEQFLIWKEYASSGKWIDLKGATLSNLTVNSSLTVGSVRLTTIEHPFLGALYKQDRISFKCGGELIDVVEFFLEFQKKNPSFIRINDFEITPSADRKEILFDFTIVAPKPIQTSRLFPVDNKVTWLLNRKPDNFLKILKLVADVMPEALSLGSLKYLCEPNECHVLLLGEGKANAFEYTLKEYAKSLSKNIPFSKVTSKARGLNRWQIKVVLGTQNRLDD